MNLLITGGSGFIGSRLVGELLQAGHQVAIYDIARSVMHPALWIPGDVRDVNSVTAAVAGRDAVIHLAAEHRDIALSTSLCEEVNVGGARNVITAARSAGCRRIIFTSSVAVYPLNVPQLAEDSPPRPFNRYGESKLTAERVLREWAEFTPGASLAIVRACVVFGEGNRGNVYNLLRQIQRRRFVMVGRGGNHKSMAYVGNLTRFLAAGLDFAPGVHLYNYADKPDLTAAELVALARRELSACAAGHAAQKNLSRSDFRASFRLPHSLGIAAGLLCDFVSMLTGRPYAISAARVRKFCAETTVSTARLDRIGFLRPYALEDALIRTIRHEFGAAGLAEGPTLSRRRR